VEGIGGHGSPAEDAYAANFITKHWSGPRFSGRDFSAASKLVTGHELVKGVPSLWEEGKNVAKNLLTRGYTIEKEMRGSSPSERARLDSALSATALVLYLLHDGGYLPSRKNPWRPVP
jgi:hypothetical protein